MWKGVGSCSGGHSIDISPAIMSTAYEFICLFGFSSYRVTILIPNNFLDSEGAYYYGGASNGADNLYAVARITNTSASFIRYSKGSNDYSSGIMYLYYR